MIKEGYIITNRITKKNILNELSKQSTFYNYKFLSLNDFISAVLGKTNKEALAYLCIKYKLTPYVADTYLSYLAYIDLKEYKSSKLNELVSIKKDLIEKGYYKYDKLLVSELKKANITFVNL